MYIKTARLILRPFEIKDAADLLDYLSKPTVNCFQNDQVTSTDEAVAVIHERRQNNDYLAVCLASTNQVIGEVLFMFEKPDTYSVGWNFNSKFQGQGYALESAKALYEYLFTVFNCRRIYAYVEEDNYSSQRLCERLGMRKEGCFVEFISFVNDSDDAPKYENTLQYAILKKEWAMKGI